MTTAQIVFAALVAVFSTARITRLITQDVYPPVAKLRAWWLRRCGESAWGMLATCPYCMSFWVGILVAGTGWLTGFHAAWWAINSLFALAYAAAYVVAYDGE